MSIGIVDHNSVELWANLGNVPVCAQKGCSMPAVAVCHYSSARSRAWLEDLTESAAREEGVLVASLMLCSKHADAFKPPISWSFTDNRAQTGDQANDRTIRRAGLSLAHSETMIDSDAQAQPEDETHIAAAQDSEDPKDSRDEAADSDTGQSAIPLVRAEDMKDTPLLQRAFRSISG